MSPGKVTIVPSTLVQAMVHYWTAPNINWMIKSWWCHHMETFSALLATCAGNSPVPGEFPTQRPVTRSFDVFFDLCPNKRLSKQSWGWWFETPFGSLWRHSNVLAYHLWNPHEHNSMHFLRKSSCLVLKYQNSHLPFGKYHLISQNVFEIINGQRNIEEDMKLRKTTTSLLSTLCQPRVLRYLQALW